MYIQHFGLAQYPFSLTPNTRYFLKLPSHQQAFNLLLKSLDEDGGFAKITGEVGTGKTMLCRKVLNALDVHKNRYVTAYIPHPILSEEGIMHAIAEELSIEREADISYQSLIKLISRHIVTQAAEQKNVILFIDEAQAMPEETLEAVHLLTKLNNGGGKNLQVVLFGQPELDTLLERPGLKPLRNSLSFGFLLPELDREGLETYVQHRLTKAGYNGPSMFTEDALNLLFDGSKGVPRVINILCHKALMSAYGKGSHLIDAHNVQNAIDDTEIVKPKKSLRQRLFSH